MGGLSSKDAPPGKSTFSGGWQEVKVGFGDLTGDFWLGLEHVYRMTKSGLYELRVEMEYQGNFVYAHYGRFSISDKSNDYRLSVGGHSDTAGDSLRHHKGYKFTTVDRDNDNHSGRNCANYHAGDWWYDSCGPVNLNGIRGTAGRRGKFWVTLSSTNPLTYSEMKIIRLTVSWTGCSG